MTSIVAALAGQSGDDFKSPSKHLQNVVKNTLASRILRSTGAFAKLREPDCGYRP
jgi:hypothetical protein